MTAKLDYTWRLREIMAEQGMFTTAPCSHCWPNAG